MWSQARTRLRARQVQPDGQPALVLGKLKRIQRSAAGVTIASATPNRSPQAKRCQTAPAAPVRADNRLQNRKLAAYGYLTPYRSVTPPAGIWSRA